MTQPQNPNADPLLARIDKNPTGADLIQVVNTAGGQGIVYRINQFQAVWYVGSGNPIFIPGELPTNLYLDNLTGHIWQLGFDFIWRLLPSGGGGSGDTVQTLSTTQGTITGAFDGVNKSFTLDTAPDTPTDLMVFLNGIYQVQGTDYTLAGSVVSLTVTPDPGGELVAIINISTESLIETLSSTNGTITGTFNGINTVFDLVITPTATPNTALFLNGIYQIQGTDYTMVSSTITMTIPPILGDQLTAVISTSGSTGGGVISLNGLLGVVNLVAGANTSISVAGQNITISSTGGTTGVPSVNSITGPVTIKAGTGIAVSTSSPNITVSATNTANVSWLDVQAFGGIPKPTSYINESTSAITTAGSPHVVLGTSLHFANGEGVCIWKAGSPTLLSVAPSAPTATAPSVQGGQTITYKVVAFDDFGGLSPASAQVQVTNAPAVFAPPPQTISSISQFGGVVTVNFSAPLNGTVTPGMTLHITGMGSVAGHIVPGDVIFNGVWTIVSAPTTSQVTYSLLGSYGSGVVGPNTVGRVSNVQLITAISRASTGVITITTSQSNNSRLSGTNHPTIVIVENCYPVSLNGHWLASSISGTTITCQTGNLTAETGTVVANGDTTSGLPTSASTATTYEYISVVCPSLSATDALQPGSIAPTTCGYYIYSDSPSPGNGLVLIGKTVSGNTPTTGNINYVDWGPCHSSGYSAPGYVPTTPPASSQNQMFTSFILSGQGSTSLILTSNVTTGVTSTIRHDDAPAINAAFAATGNQVANAVLLSPPLSAVLTPQYIVNSPVLTPTSRNFVVGCSLVCNETLAFGNACQISVIPGAVTTIDPNFGQRDYILVEGFGNPIFAGNYSFVVDGLGFQCQTNNQIGLLISGSYSQNSNCAFFTQNNTGTAVPLVYQNSTSALISNTNYSSYGPFGDVSIVGQSCFGPPIGSVWFRTTDNPNLNLVPPAQVTFSGMQTAAGRGVLFDSLGATLGEGIFFDLGDQFWNQAAITPTFMFWGSGFQDVKINNVVNDTSTCAVLANWTAALLSGVSINGGIVSDNFPVITGFPVTGLQASGTPGLNQSENVVEIITGTANIGSLNNTVPQASKTLQGQPMDLGTFGSVFAKVKVTGVTGMASGSGSFASEVWTVQVSCLCWDGTESDLSDIFTINPNPNGMQGLSLSWNAVSGTQGYLVYLRGFRQSNSPLTTNSVFYSGFSNAGSVPSLGGASGRLIVSPLNGGTVVTPNLILPSGVNKITAAAPTLTGDRVISLADGAQSTILSTSFTTVVSGSPYTVALQGVTSSSHAWIASVGAAAASDGTAYVISVGTNQVVINTSGNSGETFNVFATVN